jgi:hypothetical protein
MVPEHGALVGRQSAGLRMDNIGRGLPWAKLEHDGRGDARERPDELGDGR